MYKEEEEDMKMRDLEEGREARKHLSQFGIVNEVRSVPMDEGAQSEAILPAEQPRQGEKERQREKQWRKERENKSHSKKAGTVHQESYSRRGK